MLTSVPITSLSQLNLGIFNASAHHLLDDLGRSISQNSGEVRKTSHLYHRISVLVQRFIAALLHKTDDRTHFFIFYSIS